MWDFPKEGEWFESSSNREGVKNERRSETLLLNPSFLSSELTVDSRSSDAAKRREKLIVISPLPIKSKYVKRGERLQMVHCSSQEWGSWFTSSFHEWIRDGWMKESQLRSLFTVNQVLRRAIFKIRFHTIDSTQFLNCLQLKMALKNVCVKCTQIIDMNSYHRQKSSRLDFIGHTQWIVWVNDAVKCLVIDSYGHE